MPLSSTMLPLLIVVNWEILASTHVIASKAWIASKVNVFSPAYPSTVVVSRYVLLVRLASHGKTHEVNAQQDPSARQTATVLKVSSATVVVAKRQRSLSIVVKRLDVQRERSALTKMAHKKPAPKRVVHQGVNIPVIAVKDFSVSIKSASK